jgi:hypothetical protein
MAVSEHMASGAFLTDYPDFFARVLANGQKPSKLRSEEGRIMQKLKFWKSLFIVKFKSIIS